MEITSAATGLANRRWLSLLGICIITALVWFTASDISIALPSIGQEFGGSMDTLQWAVNGYFLAGALIIVGGRVGDVFGRRLIFAIGTLLVIVGSVIAGLSSSAGMLIAGRIVEGVGAAAILPTALAMVVVLFHGRERETAIAIWIATCWGAQALGPLVGGVLVQELGWRWIFWINLPFAILALLLTWWATPETRQEEGSRSIDIPGAVTLVGSIALVSYVLVAADNLPSSQLVALLVGALVLLVAFIAIERRATAPVVVLSIFKDGRFDGAVLANFIANFVFGAVVFFMAQYLQVVELQTPLMAGLLLLPATIPILILNPFGTAWGRRVGPGIPTFVGMVLMVIAAYLFTNLSGSYQDLLLPFVLLGIGIGLQITPCAVAAVENPGEAGEGVASGIYKASSMVGGSLGVAVSVAIFQSSARSNLAKLVETLPASLKPTEQQFETFIGALTGGSGLDSLKAIYPNVQKGITIVFDAAVGSAMWASIVASALGAVLAIWLLRGKREVDEAELT